MAGNLKFNFKDLAVLNDDFKASARALVTIVQQVLRLQLRALRREQIGLVSRGPTGKLSRSFGYSVRRRLASGDVEAVYGFMTTRRVTGRTIVAGNVQQKGYAEPRRRKYLWIPLPANQNVTPRDFFQAQNTFIATSRAGNKIAFVKNGDEAIPLFVLKQRVNASRPPVPIEAGVERRLPLITQDIQDSVAQVIEARKSALASLR